MNNLQVTNETPSKKNRIILYFHTLTFILLVANFSLNFLGSPALKYVYLAQAFIIFFAVLLFDFEQTLIEMFTLFYIEGQGRNLWEYQSWSRIIFDIVVFYSILKIFIRNKKFLNKSLLPWPAYTALILHFTWYIIEFFNIYSPSMLGVLGATKVYIYPLLFFLGLIQSNLDPYSQDFKLAFRFIMFLILAEIVLTIFQMQFKETFMIQISPYYIKAMRDGIFTGTHFRPFGTTALPGMISVYLFLSIGFLYLNISKFKEGVLKYLIMGGIAYTIILSQVRSALVKYLLIIGFVQFGIMLFERFKPKSVIPVFIVAATLVVGARTFLLDNTSTGDENIDYAKARMSTLTQIDAVKGERIDLDTFGKIFIQKLAEYPFGFGPGSTGAASSLIQDELTGNPLINKDLFWAYDNLYISLIIDLGIGAFFYIFFILYIPMYIIRYLLIFYKHKIKDRYTTLLVCLATMATLIVGNWGAIGLTYNPESFVFWFFAGLGLKVINDYRIANQTKELHQ